MSSEDRRPLPSPISDESLEYWTTEYEYGASFVVGPIQRSHLGGLLARIKKAEEEGNKTILELRDLLRRVLAAESETMDARICRVRAIIGSDLAAECDRAIGVKP
jgi:hypothetical protein